MSEHKAHHYVPQFYLRNFGIGNSISAYHIPRELFIPSSSIRGQCQRSFLYGRDPKVENTLSMLETEFSRVIRNTIQSNIPPEVLTTDHHALTTFITVQRGRTPRAGEANKERLEKITRQLVKNVIRHSKLKRELRDDEFEVELENPVLWTLKTTASLGAALMDLSMKLLVNKTNYEFITSDAPVILLNRWNKDIFTRGVLGYSSRGLQVFLPISPRHLLLLYEPEIYSVGRQGSSVIDVTNAYDVNSLNGLQLLSSDHLYFNHKNELPIFIKNLPFQWKGLGRKLSRTNRAVAEDGKSELLHQFEQQPDINLKLSFIRVTEAAKQYPLAGHIGTRPLSKAMDERFNGSRRQNSNPRDMPKKFTVVERD